MEHEHDEQYEDDEEDGDDHCLALGCGFAGNMSEGCNRGDASNRGNGSKERAATTEDLIVKDDRILRQVLDDTRQSDILVLATWNDLGEGTGINRSYDYYWDGKWKQPNHFMELIRRSQSGELLQSP